jgi:hypothetical protein
LLRNRFRLGIVSISQILPSMLDLLSPNDARCC